MRDWRWVVAALALTACGPGAANDYPERAHAKFARTCRTGDPVCDCTWDKITRSLTYDEYEAALDRFKREGLMDPRIAHARAYCIEHAH
ncbi:MAG: hypothetical protein AB7L65_09195 [Hyphomonadaceae bacterium]